MTITATLHTEQPRQVSPAATAGPHCGDAWSGAVAMLPLLASYAPFGCLVGVAVAQSSSPAAAWTGTWLIFGGTAHLIALQLTAGGGHPGNDLKHACIRRWVAPRAGTIAISGELIHEPEAGDGIRAFIISSRQGELKTATLHHSRVELSAPNVEVQPGDTIDFIVDIAGELNSDQFLWVPKIASLEAAQP